MPNGIRKEKRGENENAERSLSRSVYRRKKIRNYYEKRSNRISDMEEHYKSRLLRNLKRDIKTERKGCQASPAFYKNKTDDWGGRANIADVEIIFY